MNIFKAFLMRQAVQESKTLVLIIDEAQTLKPPLLELLRQLMNCESNDQKFLQVVLFAQEEFRVRLQHPRFRNLVNRTAMASTLENLSYAESGRDAAPPVADCRRQDLPVHPDGPAGAGYSQGIPRTQVILADNALLAAFVTGRTQIDDQVIRDVAADRGLPDSRLAARSGNGPGRSPASKAPLGERASGP